jgi:hypothetical protein
LKRLRRYNLLASPKQLTIKKEIKKMYTIIYNFNGFTFTEKRNGLCYAVMFAERHNGKVLRDGVVVWERK